MTWVQLPQLFGGYLHQDWDLEASSIEEAVRNFMDREPKVGRARDELKMLLSGSHTDAELRRLVVDVWGSSYDPTLDGREIREWLHEVASILERDV